MILDIRRLEVATTHTKSQQRGTEENGNKIDFDISPIQEDFSFCLKFLSRGGLFN